jgi:hypothetical protein
MSKQPAMYSVEMSRAEEKKAEEKAKKLVKEADETKSDDEALHLPRKRGGQLGVRRGKYAKRQKPTPPSCGELERLQMMGKVVDLSSFTSTPGSISTQGSITGEDTDSPLLSLCWIIYSHFD